MEYVIRHCESGKYLSLVKLRNEAVWVDLDKAHRFSDRQKVDNFMRMNFNNAVKGQIRKSEVEILPCDTAHMPFDSSGTLRAEITEEQANVYLDTLPDMIGQMYETGRIMRVLLSYYSDQVRVADKAQEDMLHKIEFTNANVVDGFKLYKALQEIRQRRRQCKDVCDMLGTIHRSGTVSSLMNLQNEMTKYHEHLETRTYTPRILEELFNTITSAWFTLGIAFSLASFPLCSCTQRTGWSITQIGLGSYFRFGNNGGFIMTRRQIYFYSPQSGKYYVSEEINGDKTELERMGSSDYCENTWEEILDSLKNVAGMGDFLQALARLNGIYHSSLGFDRPPTRLRIAHTHAEVGMKDQTYGITEGTLGIFLDEELSIWK